MTFPVHLNRFSASVKANCTGKLLALFGSSRKLWKRGITMRPLRILNVAEKNDAAKELSRIMSRGQCLRVGSGKIILYTLNKRVLCKNYEDEKMACFRLMWLQYFVIDGNICRVKESQNFQYDSTKCTWRKPIKIFSIVPAYLNSFNTDWYYRLLPHFFDIMLIFWGFLSSLV